jgi:hypothetical protein
VTPVDDLTTIPVESVVQATLELARESMPPLNREST